MPPRARPRPHGVWFRVLFALTNATFASVLVVEGVEVVSRDRWWVFYTDHPWFIFTATVSVLLSLAQLAVACFGETRHHLLFLSADGTWSVLWVVQLLVQALLPASHRAYTLQTVALMGGLYALQACTEAPVALALFEDYRALATATDLVVPSDEAAGYAASTASKKRSMRSSSSSFHSSMSAAGGSTAPGTML